MAELFGKSNNKTNPNKSSNAKKLRHSQSTTNTNGNNSPTLRHSQTTPAIRFDASGGLALPAEKPLFRLDMETVNMYDLPTFGKKGAAKKAWGTTSRTNRRSPSSSKESKSSSPSSKSDRKKSLSPKRSTKRRSKSPQTNSSPPESPTYDTSSRPNRSKQQNQDPMAASKNMGMRRSSLSGQMGRMTMMKEMAKQAAIIAENPRTGLEAIQYFAKQGEAAKQKFIYCIREECIDETKWSPYNLVVTDADTAVANGEHFIMSGGGLVHQIPGKQKKNKKENQAEIE